MSINETASGVRLSEIFAAYEQKHFTRTEPFTLDELRIIYTPLGFPPMSDEEVLAEKARREMFDTAVAALPSSLTRLERIEGIKTILENSREQEMPTIGGP